MSLDRFLALRAKFDVFSYESFHISASAGAIECRFYFRIQGRDTLLSLEHLVRFKGHDEPFLAITDPLFVHAVFLLGLAEGVSYWKTACPVNFTVCAGALSPEESIFWEKLYTHGLGEFYWLNGIYGHVPDDGYVRIRSSPEAPVHPAGKPDTSGCLVPVGGGKDSVVTLELLKRLPGAAGAATLECFLLSARQASYDTAAIAGYGPEKLTEAFRVFDPQLFRMNREGFLNGHVPYSAILGFTAVVAALLRGRRHIILSNEGSANEPTVPGTWVNHQYSKSLEFETDFSEYIHRFLTPSVTYFSLLRPWSEARIAMEFTRYPAYHQAFRSCNKGSRENRWCCSCPKCLFVFILIAAHAGVPATSAMFGENLLQNAGLIPILDELAGFAPVKPFECVGTVAETRWSLERIHADASLPPESSGWPLLGHYRESRTTAAITEMALGFRLIEPELALRIPPMFLSLVLDPAERGSFHDARV